MKSEDTAFLRNFFRAVTDAPIEFNKEDAARYVPLYEDPAFSQHDPVKLLSRPIEFALGQSVHLFSGFRGSGKSTELRRLRKHLTSIPEGDYKVVLCDIEDYINLSQPVDISDFLMAIAGGFGETIFQQGSLKGDPAQEGYWTRLGNFLKRTRIDVTDVSGGIKASLKSDPSFRENLQKRMAGHLGALVEDVRAYITQCIKQIKELHGPNTEVVLLVDSMEHIRGTSTNATAVQDSVLNLFTSHSDKLHFDHLHVVYTIPPYLKVLYPNLGTLYSPGGVHVIPSLKVWNKHRSEIFQPSLDLLEKVVSRRGKWELLLGQDRAVLDHLSRLSGGHIRDFLRLFSEIIRRADQLPVPAETVEAAVAQVRSEYLPIADADAKWLSVIAETHSVALPKISDVHDLARYLDTHLALCYRNGEEWYDVHPLIRDVVETQADEASKRAARHSGS
jgi:hypothetical protein